MPRPQTDPYRSLFGKATDERLLTFGQRMRYARERMGMSQDELASLLDTNQARISLWENDSERPRRAAIERIAAALDIPTIELTAARRATYPGSAGGMSNAYIDAYHDVAEIGPDTLKAFVGVVVAVAKLLTLVAQRHKTE